MQEQLNVDIGYGGGSRYTTQGTNKKTTVGILEHRAILKGNKDLLYRTVNPPSLRILRIDREGMIDETTMHMISFMVMSYNSICPKILVYSK